MSELILLRHAKAEEHSLMRPDFKRHLRERGRDDSRNMAAYLRKLNIIPDMVLCSTANRTRETWEIFAEILDYNGKVEYLESIYHASAPQLYDVMAPYLKKSSRLMLVGHNMGISQLADRLCKEGCQELPTCGIAIVGYNGELEPYRSELKMYLTPKTI